MKRSVDIWYGSGDGVSIKIEGFLISENLIEITDLDWHDNMGWKPEDGPYIYDCLHLDDTYYVSYDDYGWSEKGFVPETSLTLEDDGTIFIAHRNRKELWPKYE